MSVLLDIRRSPDLPTGGDRNRTRRHHNQIRDAKTVRVQDRRGDFTHDGDELIHRVLLGVATVLEFDDGDELFGLLIQELLSPRTGPALHPGSSPRVVRRAAAAVPPRHGFISGNSRTDTERISRHCRRTPKSRPSYPPDMPTHTRGRTEVHDFWWLTRCTGRHAHRCL